MYAKYHAWLRSNEPGNVYTPISDSLAALLDVFLELIEILTTVSIREVIDWCRVTGVDLSCWEILTLVRMLNVYRQHVPIYSNSKTPNPLATPIEIGMERSAKLIQLLKAHSKDV